MGKAGLQIAIFLHVLLLACPSAVSTEANDVEALLRQLESQTGFTAPLYARIDVLHKGEWCGPDGVQLDLPGDRRRTWSDIYYDGARLGIETRNYLGDDAAPQSSAERVRTVFASGAYSQYIETLGTTGEGTVRYRRASAETTASPPYHSTWGLELLGMVPGSHQTIAEALRAAPERYLAPDHELVGQTPCQVLTATGPDARWRVWLDPEAGGLPLCVRGTLRIPGDEAPGFLERFQIDCPPQFQDLILDGLVWNVMLDVLGVEPSESGPHIAYGRIKQIIELRNGNSYRITNHLKVLAYRRESVPGAVAFLSMTDLPAAPEATGVVSEFRFGRGMVAPGADGHRGLLAGMGSRLARLWRDPAGEAGLLLAVSAGIAILVNVLVYRSGRLRTVDARPLEEVTGESTEFPPGSGAA